MFEDRISFDKFVVKSSLIYLVMSVISAFFFEGIRFPLDSINDLRETARLFRLEKLLEAESAASLASEAYLLTIFNLPVFAAVFVALALVLAGGIQSASKRIGIRRNRYLLKNHVALHQPVFIFLLLLYIYTRVSFLVEPSVGISPSRILAAAYFGRIAFCFFLTMAMLSIFAEILSRLTTGNANETDKDLE